MKIQNKYEDPLILKYEDAINSYKFFKIVAINYIFMFIFGHGRCRIINL